MSASVEPPSTADKIWGVVAAAGVGARMQAAQPKQYLRVAGKSVLAHSLSKLCRNRAVYRVVVGIAAGDAHWPKLGFRDAKLSAVACGGEHRMHTVANALQTIAAQPESRATDWVMVHDAARPCVSQADLDALVAAATASPHGALLATPVTDALVAVQSSDAEGAWMATEPAVAAGYWRALTPQMCRLGELQHALQAVIRAGEVVADESAAMRRRGLALRLVRCRNPNIKLTWRSDVALAACLLAEA